MLDTDVSNFVDVTYEVIPPGSAVTLFPANVYTSPDVTGQELLYSTTTIAGGVYDSTLGGAGGFQSTAPGTTCNFIGLDFIAPRGLYYANSGGGLDARSVSVRVEYAAVDVNTGAITGSWNTLANLTYSAATTTPQRYSERISVATGRYVVRVTRVSAPDGSVQAGDALAWAGYRGYVNDSRTYGDVTLIAMRMKASALTSQSNRKVNVVATRDLPIYNAATSSWSAPTATRSPAWAFAYAAKQMGLTDAQLDLPGLVALDATWAARGDTLDARFDNFVTFWEAAIKVGGVGRAKPFMQGGVLRLMRDQAATIPVAMFSTRNI